MNTNTGGLETFDSESFQRFARDWEATFDRGEAARMASFYAEDARLVATDMATIEGRPAIERFWRASSEGARSIGLHRTVRVDHVERDGSLGYARGTVVLQVGSAPPRSVRYVTLWRRGRDDAWRCIVDISSPEPQK